MDDIWKTHVKILRHRCRHDANIGVKIFVKLWRSVIQNMLKLSLSIVVLVHIRDQPWSSLCLHMTYNHGARPLERTLSNNAKIVCNSCFATFNWNWSYLVLPGQSLVKLPNHDDVIKWKHFRVTGPLYGKFTGHWIVPRTNASDAELWCFLWSAPD